MVITDYKEYFKSDYAVMRLGGTWIGPDHKKIPIWYKLYSFVIHTNALMFAVSMVINWILKSTSLRGSASFGYVIMTLITGELKGLLLLKNYKLAEVLFEEYNNEHFQMKEKEEIELGNLKLHQFHIIRTALKVTILICLLLIVFAPLILGTMELIYPAWFPYDAYVSPNYQISYLHQAIGLSSVAVCNAYGDTLMAGFCLFIGLQCNLLAVRLEKIGYNEAQPEKQLLACIKHYKHILRYLSATNKTFDIIYFLQFFATTVSMCMDLFLLSVIKPGTYEFVFLFSYLLGVINMLLIPCWFASEMTNSIKPGTYEFVFLFSYLLGVMNMLLIPCWFASEMTNSSEKISSAAYSCNWTDANNNFKKDLNMFICRSQKPMKLYGAKFFEVSVLTFLSVVRTSMSYFAVMRNLNTHD